jgi:hypothetical protein
MCNGNVPQIFEYHSPCYKNFIYIFQIKLLNLAAQFARATQLVIYENRFSIPFEMLEFEVNTLQEVSKPVQSRDMSKINLPCDCKVMESDTWRCS